MHQAEIYISYAWGRDKTAPSQQRQKVFDEVFHLLKEKKYKVIVDFEGIAYKHSITKFMQTLSRANYIVMIISDRYLKSESCMFEATEMIKNGEFRDRIFPIVLPDANIHTASGKKQYLQYWVAQKKAQQTLFESIDNKEFAQSHLDKLKQFDEIVRMLDPLLATLSDMNTKSIEELRESNYKPLLHALNVKLVEQEAWVTSETEAYSLLKLPPTATPSQLLAVYQELLQEYQNGISNAALEEIREANIVAVQRVKAAHDLLLPLARKHLRQQKTIIKRNIRNRNYIEAKILLETLLRQEPNDKLLEELLETCNDKVSLQGYEEAEKDREEIEKLRRETQKASEKNKNAKEKTSQQRQRRRTDTTTPDTTTQMVSTQKMRKNMQVSGKNTEKNIYRKIIVPAVLAAIAIILGFIMKEKVLSYHVDEIILSARNHVEQGELSTALRELEDASRDLVYEERLSQELENFKTLKAQTDELLQKIRTFKKEKKWSLAEKALLRLLEFTPKDSFLMYQLKEVRKEIKKNDVKFWMLTASEAIKQGESGYLRAKEALVQAQQIGINEKVIDANLEKIESMINLAFDRHVSKASMLSKSTGSLAQAIKEYEAALQLKPDDAEVKRKLRDCKTRQ